jgi:hypothetical protein
MLIDCVGTCMGSWRADLQVNTCGGTPWLLCVGCKRGAWNRLPRPVQACVFNLSRKQKIQLLQVEPDRNRLQRRTFSTYAYIL